MQPILTPVGFGAQLGEWGWVFAVAAVTGLIAKENVISTFATLAACIAGAALAEDESGVSYVQAMIDATGIGIPGLIALHRLQHDDHPLLRGDRNGARRTPQGEIRLDAPLLAGDFLRRLNGGVSDRHLVVDGVPLRGRPQRS